MIVYSILVNLVLLAYLVYTLWTCGDLIGEPIMIISLCGSINGVFFVFYSSYIQPLPMITMTIPIFIVPLLLWFVASSIYRYMRKHDLFPKPKAISLSSSSLREYIEGIPEPIYNTLLEEMSFATKDWFKRWYHNPIYSDEWYTQHNQPRLRRLRRYLKQK